MASMNYAKVRAVSFDVDDTLVYRTASRRTYYKRVLDSAGLRFSESTIQKATQALFEWERENFHALDGSNTVKIRMLFSTLLQELGVRGDKALTSRLQRIREKETAWALYADVKPTFRKIRQRGIKIVIVTNRPRWVLKGVTSS